MGRRTHHEALWLDPTFGAPGGPRKFRIDRRQTGGSAQRPISRPQRGMGNETFKREGVRAVCAIPMRDTFTPNVRRTPLARGVD
jgi:hypothetical protein